MTHLPAALAVALAATLPALSGCSPDAQAAPALEASAIPVRTTVVARGPIDRPIRAAGTIVTKDEWDLAFKVGGLLASVTVHEGQAVRRGQVLATLDPTELAAGVRQAREGLEKARRDAARAAQLAAGEVAPRTAVEDTRTAVALAEAQLEAADFNLRHARLTAPGDGWVDHRLAEPGEVVAPGRPIVHLSGQGRGFVVRAALADRDVIGLTTGTPARIALDARPGPLLEGRVTEIARAAGRGTGTYQVEIALAAADAGGLLSGLTAKVEIARTVQAAGAVPLAAVVDGDGEQGAVFTVRDGAAHRVPVRIAFLQGEQAVLSAGLDGVARVVTDGAPRLADGTRVTESPSLATQRSLAMHVADFAVRRWQFTLVVFLALVALGVSSLIGIPKAEDPTFPYPNFAVVAVLPGASPSDVERLVVDPLESELKGLDDVKSIKTTIDDGLAVVQIEFTAGTDPARKRDEVIRETTALRPRLPAELARLQVEEFNAARVNILQVALATDTVPYRDLDRLARDLKARLEAVPGVGKVEIAGLPRQEVQVALAPERLAALGISPLEVYQAIGADAQAIPAGAVDAGARQLSVKTSGDYGSIGEIADTVVRMVGGRAVRVRDLAEVAQRDAEATHLVRFDGRRAVLVAANQKEKQNIFDVRRGLGEAIEAFRPSLPPGLVLATSFDQTVNVEHRLSGFARDFAIAVLLVLVTLLPLGLRASGVVMTSIPLSLTVGLTLLHLFGFSINQLSIVGFVIALGLLVDDSVVVVENITRFLREGHPPREAAIEATRQITLSVLGCTATLIFAFVPLLALPGAAGSFIRSMPVAVVFTILASLLVSLTVVPFLASRFLKAEGTHGNLFFRGLERAIQVSYRPVLHRAIARPAVTLGVAGLLFAGALALVPSIGFSLFPKAGIPQFRVTAEAPEGASLAEADRAARAIEAALARHPEVRRVTTNVGKGNPSVYYNVATQNEKAGYAEVLAELDTRDAGRTATVLASLRAELTGYAGARIEVREFEQGPPVDAPVAIRVLADDPAALAVASARVEAVLASVAGTRYVRNPARDRKSDLRVRIDRERAALLGVAVPDVDKAVRLAVGGLVAGAWREATSDQARDIRLTVPREGGASLPGGPRPGLPVLDRVYLAGAGGVVPLAQVSSLALEPSPARIYHYDKIRSTTVTADVREGFNTDKITKAVLARLDAEPWPAGVRIVPAGEFESRQESFGGLGAAIIVAALGVLAILVLEFRTFRSTLIVASVIPLGIVGGMVALFLSGYTLSFTAMIGFVALMGIEVKNSILLVDFTNQLRQQGRPLDQAIEEAGEKRFIPILLTTLTAVGGLVPLALERSALYSPLALVILGGLISSTLLTRVVTPVLYKLLPPELEAEPVARSTVPAASLADPVTA